MSTHQPKLGRLARFLAVSALGFALNLTITGCLHELLGTSEELAFAVALITVFSYNFVACRYFIFRATNADPRQQLIKYALSSAAFRLAEYAAFVLIHTVLNVHYLVAAVLVLGASFFGKYFFYGSVVFTDDPPKDSNTTSGDWS